MQYFRHIVSKEPAFAGGRGRAGTACKVLAQLCDLKAKPLCVKRSGTSKIEQEHSIHAKMTVEVTETYSDLAN